MGAIRIFASVLLLASLSRAEPEKLHLGWGHTWTSYYKPDQYKAYRNPPGDVEELEGDDLWYVGIELAPGKVLLCALNTQSDPPQGWFDRNFNGQVKDEEPVELERYLARLKYEYELDTAYRRLRRVNGYFF